MANVLKLAFLIDCVPPSISGLYVLNTNCLSTIDCNQLAARAALSLVPASLQLHNSWQAFSPFFNRTVDTILQIDSTFWITRMCQSESIHRLDFKLVGVSRSQQARTNQQASTNIRDGRKQSKRRCNRMEVEWLEMSRLINETTATTLPAINAVDLVERWNAFESDTFQGLLIRIRAFAFRGFTENFLETKLRFKLRQLGA